MTSATESLSAEEKQRRRRQQRAASLADRYLGTEEAAIYFGHSIVHFRALVKAGKLPQPVRIAGRKLLWRQSLLAEFATAREVEQGVRPSSAA